MVHHAHRRGPSPTRARRRPPPPTHCRANGHGGRRRLHRHRPAPRFRRRHGDRRPRSNLKFPRRRLHQLDCRDGARRTSLRPSRRRFFRCLRRSVSQPVRRIPRPRRLLAGNLARHRHRNDRRRHLHGLLDSQRSRLCVGAGLLCPAARRESAQRRLLRTLRILAIHGEARDPRSLHHHRSNLVARRSSHAPIQRPGRILPQRRVRPADRPDLRHLQLRRSRISPQFMSEPSSYCWA